MLKIYYFEYSFQSVWKNLVSSIALFYVSYVDYI